ncbi:plasma membrane ferric-chelate reductase [Sporothrix brasiliensis 5110]|uniref:Plasma membrane ferric-chelate reductase n=1 Tax=Sporothrix brasiliensis 5110 TaxID=1398154 RepID=A0A0C2IHP8_9PEZI|nr:plasma membrane ferric-chelate reductase [Sporothrix brasiliensis 5110]KIH86530.1 plasma membrane ferric-chelate reductase [Sporothrix brasiliensis 5110]
MRKRKTSSRPLLPLLCVVAGLWTAGVMAHASPSINDIDVDGLGVSSDDTYSLTSLRHIGSAPAPVVVRSDPETCLHACQLALREPTFVDVPPEAGFRVKDCYSPLMQASLFICLRGYCSDGRGAGSLDEMNRSCTALRNEPLPSFEGVLADYPPDKVLGLRRLQRPEAVGGTVLSEVVVLSEQLYENSYDTLADLIYVRKYHHGYGRTTTGYHQVDEEEAEDDDPVLGDIDATGRDSYDQKQGMTPAGHSFARRPRVWLQRHLTMPATFGQRCSQDFGWYTVPPRVQSFTLLIFAIMNTVFCLHGYRVFTGNIILTASSWPTITQQLLRYVSDRTGIISWANFPLIWLFGMRNNILLWLTGWDFGTYNNFHRWVARIATVQAIVHSIGYTALVWKDGGFASFLNYWARFFWWTGGVATICMSLLLGLSLYWIRRHAYEVFLLVHIGFSILILFGMLAHVSIFHGEYDVYFWACIVVWVADRAMRALRIVAFNPLFWKTRAQATYDPQSNIVRVVVPYNASLYQPQPGTFYYLHVLNDKRFWESHPFTVATVTSLEKKRGPIPDVDADVDANAPSSISPQKRRLPPQMVELENQSNAQSDTEDVNLGVDTDADTPTAVEHDTSENSRLLSNTNYGSTCCHNPYQPPSNHEQRPSCSRMAATAHSVASSAVSPPAHAASSMTFLIRPYDSFTGRLRDKAAAAANPGYSSTDCSAGSVSLRPAPANLRVVIDGPYGHAQRFDDEYDSVLFVVGGSGIVVALSHLTGLGRDYTLCKATAAGRRLKHIRIVWAVREAAFAAEVLREDLGDIFGHDRDNSTSGMGRTRVTMDIYVTQSKPSGSSPVGHASEENDEDETVNGSVRASHDRPKNGNGVDRPQLPLGDTILGEPLPHNVRLLYGRPDVRSEVEVAARRGRNRVGSADRKLAVVACGPGRMADEARKSVVDVLGRRDAGNIDYLEESFQW